MGLGWAWDGLGVKVGKIGIHLTCITKIRKTYLAACDLQPHNTPLYHEKRRLSLSMENPYKNGEHHLH